MMKNFQTRAQKSSKATLRRSGFIPHCSVPDMKQYLLFLEIVSNNRINLKFKLDRLWISINQIVSFLDVARLYPTPLQVIIEHYPVFWYIKCGDISSQLFLQYNIKSNIVTLLIMCTIFPFIFYDTLQILPLPYKHVEVDQCINAENLIYHFLCLNPSQCHKSCRTRAPFSLHISPLIRRVLHYHFQFSQSKFYN